MLKAKDVKQILKDTAYPHTAASPEEMKCLTYLQNRCERIGLKTKVEGFPIERAHIHSATLTLDGKEYPCKAYIGCGLAQTAALRPHWGLIHSRGRFESLPKIPKKKPPERWPFLWWGCRDSNPRPLRCEHSALTS